MLFWGPPSKFVSGSGEPKKEKSEIVVIDDARTAERLLKWINKQTQRFVVPLHFFLSSASLKPMSISLASLPPSSILYLHPTYLSFFDIL